MTDTIKVSTFEQYSIRKIKQLLGNHVDESRVVSVCIPDCGLGSVEEVQAYENVEDALADAAPEVAEPKATKIRRGKKAHDPVVDIAPTPEPDSQIEPVADPETSGHGGVPE